MPCLLLSVTKNPLTCLADFEREASSWRVCWFLSIFRSRTAFYNLGREFKCLCLLFELVLMRLHAPGAETKLIKHTFAGCLSGCRRLFVCPGLNPCLKELWHYRLIHRVGLTRFNCLHALVSLYPSRCSPRNSKHFYLINFTRSFNTLFFLLCILFISCVCKFICTILIFYFLHLSSALRLGSCAI